MPETVTTLTLAALVASLLSIGLKGQGDRRFLRVAWGLGLALFVANGLMAEALPFGNMRHVLCIFPLVMAPAAWYLQRSRGLDLVAWLGAAAAIALVGALCMPLQAGWRQMPALQSPWFAPHVTSYVISYALMAVSALLALKSYLGDRDALLDKADAVVRLAFPFMTFGLWSGALWADAAWGGYWAWDIKEAWSLLTWTLCLIYLHTARTLPGWRRGLILLGFAAVLVTFLVVNLLPKLQSLHSYAQ